MRFGGPAAIPAIAWLLAGAGPAGAAVYRWVDEEAAVHDEGVAVHEALYHGRPGSEAVRPVMPATWARSRSA